MILRLLPALALLWGVAHAQVLLVQPSGGSATDKAVFEKFREALVADGLAIETVEATVDPRVEAKRVKATGWIEVRFEGPPEARVAWIDWRRRAGDVAWTARLDGLNDRKAVGADLVGAISGEAIRAETSADFTGGLLMVDGAYQPRYDGLWVNISPLAPALFKMWSGNVGYLIGGYHGLGAEVSHASFTDDGADDQVTVFQLTYRLHWSGEMNSGFLYLAPAFLRGRGSTEDSFIGPDGFLRPLNRETEVDHFAFFLGAGKRWHWNNGFNVAFRVAVSPIGGPEDQAEKDSLHALDVIDGEFSLGWVF